MGARAFSREDLAVGIRTMEQVAEEYNARHPREKKMNASLVNFYHRKAIAKIKAALMEDDMQLTEGERDALKALIRYVKETKPADPCDVHEPRLLAKLEREAGKKR